MMRVYLAPHTSFLNGNLPASRLRDFSYDGCTSNAALGKRIE